MNKLSVLIGPMLALGLIVSGAASASVLPQVSAKSIDAAPLYLATSDRCTLAAPDLSALAIWSRYPNPAHAGSVMIPELIRVALDTDHAGCQGLVRDKSYVVELPNGRS